MKPTMAATTTKIAVHAPCVDTALREIEIPSMPEPATKTQSVQRSVSCLANGWNSLTETECESEQVPARVAKHQASRIINAIDISVVKAAMTQRMMTPGTKPSVSNATGIERTPSPIWVFIIRAAVPSHPT
jgi:hypothetical protein